MQAFRRRSCRNSGRGLDRRRGNQMARPPHWAAQAALRYFESVQDRDFETFLLGLRRPAPSPPFRAVILEN